MLATGRRRLAGVAFVSHHFMNADELATPLGQEREASCVFRVPVGGRLESMCRVNAKGLRDDLYQRLRDRRSAPGTARPVRPAPSPSRTTP